MQNVLLRPFEISTDMESPFKFTRTVVLVWSTAYTAVEFRSQWCGAPRGAQRWWRLWWREWTLWDRGGRAPLQQTSNHSRWQPCLRHHVSDGWRIDYIKAIVPIIFKFGLKISCSSSLTLSVITRISLRIRLSSRWTPGGKLPAEAGVDEPPPPDGAATDVPGTPSKSLKVTVLFILCINLYVQMQWSFVPFVLSFM